MGTSCSRARAQQQQASMANRQHVQLRGAAAVALVDDPRDRVRSSSEPMPFTGLTRRMLLSEDALAALASSSDTASPDGSFGARGVFVAGRRRGSSLDAAMDSASAVVEEVCGRGTFLVGTAGSLSSTPSGSMAAACVIKAPSPMSPRAIVHATPSAAAVALCLEEEDADASTANATAPPSLLEIAARAIARTLPHALPNALDALDCNCQQRVLDAVCFEAESGGAESLSPRKLMAFGTDSLCDISLAGAAVGVEESEWDLPLGRQTQLLRFRSGGCESLLRFGWLSNAAATLLCLDLSDSSVCDDDLRTLSKATSLRSLSLRRCSNLTGSGLQFVGGSVGATTPASNGSKGIALETLDLSECASLGNGKLRGLGRFLRLQSLSLGWCRGVNDADLRSLRGCGGAGGLQSLDLSGTRCTDAGLQHVSTLGKRHGRGTMNTRSGGGTAGAGLHTLKLTSCRNVSDSGVAACAASLASLRAIDLRFCGQLTSACLQMLGPAALRLVEEFRCSHTSICDAGLEDGVASMAALRVLVVDSCPVGDDGVVCLSVLQRLESFSAQDTGIGNAGLAAIAKCPSLRHLNVDQTTHINDGGIRALCSRAKGLVTLCADTRSVTDDSMEAIGELKALETLCLFGAQVSDTGVRHLSGLKSLKKLELCSGAIENEGCAVLGTLKSLEHLNLCNNDAIGDKGASSLHRLPNLRLLNLCHSRITNGGVGRLVGALPALETLVVYECPNVSQLGIEKIDHLASSCVFIKA